MSVAVSDLIATEEVPGGRAGTETAASRVPAKFLVRVLASLLTEQAKDGFDSARWLQVRSHYCRLHTGLGLGLGLRLGLGLGLGSGRP